MTASLQLDPAKPGPAIDAEFTGLSYETAQLAYPDFFAATNGELVGYVKGLAKRGVLRLGGNTSEYAFWSPEAAPAQGHSGPGIAGPDKGHGEHRQTQTTPTAIRNLREFLDATGWRCLYGLNLGKGTPEQAAAEAVFVANTLGDKLIAFQIGNEADLYHHNGLRTPDYAYAAFAKEWRRFFDAVLGRLPEAKFAGPDVSGTETWVREFADEFGKDVVLLTSHYYAEGPPTNPDMTIERLLSPSNPRWIGKNIPALQAAMASSHLPYRLDETNSCYAGGKQGVSNTFASALWAGDLMLQMAAAGASGINFHGGGYGWYAPIVGDLEKGFTARPEYYGILMAAQMVNSRLIAAQLEADGMDGLLTAYASSSANGAMKVALFNKSADKAVSVTIKAAGLAGPAVGYRLAAPRLDGTQDVTFAGSVVGADGAWRPEITAQLSAADGALACSVPAGSALLVEMNDRH